jgi:tyrosyl-tRNA synthetase
VGGSDQWGNITAGADLIRRLRGQSAYGLTFPLITTAAGAKFGKSAGNAVWLDAARTSPWEFYQYLVRQDDRDVARFLRIYTFLPLEEIAELEREIERNPEKRAAQRALAYTVTAMVHGEPVANDIRHAAEVVYDQHIRGVSESVLQEVFASAPTVNLPAAWLEQGRDILDVLSSTGVVKSKSEGRRQLEAGAVYVNNVRVPLGTRITKEHLATESLIVLRLGKKNYVLGRVQP